MSSMVSQMTEAEQLQKAIGHSLKITSSPSHCRPDHIRPGRRATIFRPRTHTEGDDKNAGLSEEEALRKAIENSLEAATEQEEEAKVLKCPLAGCPYEAIESTMRSHWSRKHHKTTGMKYIDAKRLVNASEFPYSCHACGCKFRKEKSKYRHNRRGCDQDQDSFSN